MLFHFYFDPFFLFPGDVSVTYEVSGGHNARKGTGRTDPRGRLDIQDLFEGNTITINAIKPGMVEIRDMVKEIGTNASQTVVFSLSEKLTVSSRSTRTSN